MNVQQLEHLHAKFAGTGHADTSKFEWMLNAQRDTSASVVAHIPLLSYMAVAENESVERMRYKMMEKMIQPCGRPPKKLDI